MTLIIKVPQNFSRERKYIIGVLFSYWLGINYQVKECDLSYYQISLKDDSSLRTIIFSDIFFSSLQDNYLTDKGIPSTPLRRAYLENEKIFSREFTNLPILFGDGNTSNRVIDINLKTIKIDIDIFGSAFFMLTRYEELVKPDRDENQRFPASASLAYREGFLDRPIINEYLEILWCCMKFLWPSLERKARRYQMILSHDVDHPYQYAFLTLTNIIKNCGGDLIKRKNYSLAVNNFYNWQKVRSGIYTRDPNNTFNLIINISERYKLKSTFFFQAQEYIGRHSKFSIKHPLIKSLIKKIADSGHEIGIHPRIDSFRSFEQIKADTDLLKMICHQLGIEQLKWGGRQHFLQWEVPLTWQIYQDVGLDYDSSLSFAEQAGFRCGTCYNYPVFNLLTRQELSLIEKPLIVMECSLLSDIYMNLNHEDSFIFLKKIIDKCKIYNGDFTLLWHNTSLQKANDIELYLKVIEYGIEKQ